VSSRRSRVPLDGSRCVTDQGSRHDQRSVGRRSNRQSRPAPTLAGRLRSDRLAPRSVRAVPRVDRPASAGSTRTIRMDVRLVAATNRDLAAMVADGRSRSDLYYRLNVFPVVLPPLRERPDDIPRLVRHFSQQFARRMGRRIETIPSVVLEALVRYTWPGNVRELQNVIERAVILSPGGRLRPTGDTSDVAPPAGSPCPFDPTNP
jgi:hypothetical protein